MGMLAALAARPAGAGPWSIEPRFGVEDDYTTNPLLTYPAVPSEERVAAIYDLPLRYDTDEFDFMLRPNGRYSDQQGYSSLASNYEHLDGSAQYADELDSAVVQAEVARDSSLYYLGGIANRIGVPRDSANTSGDWTHSLTERSNIELDGFWIRVRYDEPPDFNGLTDYRYWTAGPTLSFAASERNSVKLIGSYSVYQSLNGLTQSKSESIQMGLVRRLTEIWTLSLTAGYSRSTDSDKIYVYQIYYLGTQTSNQDSGVYSASLTRQGERFNFTASVARALQPTGFAYLTRQDSVNVTATYIRSERLDFALSGVWLKAVTPEQSFGQPTPSVVDVDQHYLNARLTANWHWTPQWTVSLSVTKISQQSGPPTVSAASTNIGLSVSRQFLRTQF